MIDIQNFAARYVAVWNETDPMARRGAISAAASRGINFGPGVGLTDCRSTYW